MDRLIDNNQRCIGLLNLLIHRKLSTISPEDEGEGEKNATQSAPEVIMFSGETGTGKNTTTGAIAELHRRPLVKLHMAKPGAARSYKTLDLTKPSELARSWNAFVLLDNAQTTFRKSDGLFPA